jgi:hypothetical protein
VNRYVTALLLLLLAQALVAAAVFWPQRLYPTDQERPVLLALDPFTIHHITVGDEYDNLAVLKRTGQRWVLPQLGGLPANPRAVEALLAALETAADAWPVADSAAARQRFQVADYLYRRRIDISASGSEETIFLGTSPGFRKVHARNIDQGEIYSIGFNTFDAPAVAGGWLDPSLLQIRAPLTIVSDGYSLERTSDGWRTGTGEAPDERELEALLGALRTLQIDGVANEDAQRDLAGAEARLVITINTLGGETTLELFELDDKRYILSSAYPFFFTLSEWDYDRLTGIDQRLLSD